MAEQTEKKVEQSSEGSQKTPESVKKEVDAGRPELVEKQKAYIDYLKTGGKSGISAEFGKPMWLITEAVDDEEAATPGTDDSEGILDSIKTRAASLFKVIGGENVLNMFSARSNDAEKSATTGAQTSAGQDTIQPGNNKDSSDAKKTDAHADHLVAKDTGNGSDTSFDNSDEEKKLSEAAAAIYRACEGGDESEYNAFTRMFKGLGTDDDTIVEVLQKLSLSERRKLEEYYQNTYKVSLREHLRSEADSPEERIYFEKLIDRKDGETVVKPKSKREEALEKVDRGKVKEAAKVLNDELGTGYTDSDKVFETLESLSDAEREVLEEIYEDEYDEKLSDALRSEFIGDNEKRALELLYRSDSDTQVEGVNSNSMKKAAEALDEEIDSTFGPDADVVHTLLNDRTEAEREVMAAYYKQKTGRSLEADLKKHFDGAELDKVLNALNRKDGSAEDAGRIHTALIERDQWVEGRSDETCEKDIRDTLATMNSDQIEQLKEEYEERYGISLERALLEDKNLSEATKEAIKIYLKGADQRTDDDTLKLAEIALKEENIDMFQEAFRNSSQEARDRFFAEGGKEKIEDAFWGTDEDHAMEYARKGELGVTTLIDDNQSWLGDNEKAIEAAIAKMRDSERKQYVRGKELANDNPDPESLSDEDRAALEFYTKLNESLADAGDSTEVARWEDMIATKGGTLVAKLSEHCGNVYDDDLSEIVQDIENMSEADWKRLKGTEGEKYRSEIEQMLKTYLSDDDVARCMDVVDKKMKAESFDEASKSAQRSIIEKLQDAGRESAHWYGPNVKEKDVYDAIAKMTPEEQDKYRNDPEFKAKVDDLVTDLLEFSEEDAAMAMLDRVSNGLPPEDIVTRVMLHAADTDTDEAVVVREVLKEFRDNPELKERIVNPKTPEDEAYRAKFEEALKSALGSSDFEKYGKPILETGRLPIDVQMELNEGVFDDDEQGFYKDILALAESKDEAAIEEKKKILEDKDYQEKVLAALSAEERELALNALKQGKMEPEDVIRSYLLGAGTGEEEVKEALKGLDEEGKERVKNEYARKYGADLTYDLLDELGGQDAVDAKRAVRRDSGDARTEFNAARDEFYESRDGIGKTWVDSMWDGTGYQADEAFNNFAKAMEKYAAKFEELPPDKRKELMENLQTAIDQFRASKGQLADGLTDAVIAVACVAGGFVTEGSTWVILGALIAGGFFKVGAKGAIVGSDYDWTSSDVIKDFASGGVDAALSFVGPGAGAQLFKMGERAGISAAKVVLKEAVTEGGEKLLKEGTEEALQKGMVALVRDSIADGSYKISHKGVDNLVEQVARQGATRAEKDALRKSITESLDQAVKKEGEDTIKRLAREYFLNACAGALGGGGSGTVRGIASWDESKSFAENMENVGKMAAMSAAFGAGGAVAFTAVFKVGGKAYHAVKEHYNLKPGEKLNTEQLDELAKKSGGKDATAKYNENGDIEITSKVETPAKRAEQVTPDDLARQLPEWNNLTAAEKAAMLERISKHPMYSPDAVGDFSDSAAKLMQNWEGKTAQQRAAELQKLMNDFTDKHGLPRTKIETTKGKAGPEGASYADGKIEIAEGDLMGKVDPHTLIERLYHEAVHNEQDALVVRSLADELKIGKTANADEAAAMKKLYEERTGRTLSDEHLREVLRVRNGEELSPEQTLRAKEAAKAFKDYPFNRPEYEANMESHRAVSKELEKLSDPASANNLMDRLAHDDGSLGRTLFGRESPPPEVAALLKKHRTGQASAEEVKSVLGPILQKRQSELYQYQIDTIKDYYNNLNEAEAYAIGRKAKLHAEKSFHTGETVMVGEREFTVVGADGEHVIIRPRGDASPEGPGIKPTDADLAGDPPKFRRVNDEYYVDADDNYYLARRGADGRTELIADADTFAVNPARLKRAKNEIPGDGNFPRDGNVPPGARSLEDDPTQEIKIADKTADGKPKDAGSEPPPVVKEILDRADIPGDERAALLKRIGENKLASPEAMKDFSKNISDATSKWNDITPLATAAETSAGQLRTAFGNYRDQLIAKAPSGMKEADLIKMEASEVRKLFKDDPDVMKALDDYVRVRDANAKVQEKYLQGLGERIDQLQKVFDDFADKNGLPRVKIDAADAVRMGDADGLYSDGKILLRESDFLRSDRPQKFMEFAYHEFVHHQQDNLIVRSVIDDVETDLGRTLTDSDMARMKELNEKMRHHTLNDGEFSELADLETAVALTKKAYKEKAGSDLSDEHLTEVLKARKGEKLTAAERLRADDLGKAFKENSPPGESYRRAGEDLSVTTNELSKLDQAWAEYDLIHRLAEDNGTLSRHLFGSDSPPPEVRRIIDIHNRMAAGESLTWPSEHAKFVLKQLLNKQITSLTDFRTAVYKEYLTGFHEQEAWVIGRTLRYEASVLKATAKTPPHDGTIPDGKPEDTLMDFPRSRRDTLPGLGAVEPPSRFAGETIQVNDRDYIALAEDGNDVILRRISNPFPLGEPLSIAPSEIGTKYKPLGETGYYRTASGDAFILREGPNGYEMVPDRNVAPMETKEFLQILKEVPATP
ncbi:MAG TPA: hypothetical protein V6D17_00380 [Candidatus Obscuribacterales bacterium]